MKKMIVILSVLLVLTAAVISFTVFAEEEAPKLTATVPFEVTPEDLVIKEESTGKAPTYEDLTAKFLTLNREVTDTFNTYQLNRIDQNFNRIYPILAEKFNYGVMFDIVYGIDTETESVAYQMGGRNANEKYIAMNPKFFSSDFSALSHELTHAMQVYRDSKYGATPNANGGSWLTEGVADFSRYIYEPAPFDLPAFSSNQSYIDSYRVTARFFVWCNENVDPTFLEQLNEGLKCEAYTAKLFVKITGKTVDELWQMYAESDHKIKS
ncbi:MAG: hypothetical protein IJW46_03720 [Clostridia bacterium]|nr:hypothetical protein [Clostridia bacterium]